MVLGRVIGNVVCTIKHPGLTGCKLLIVQPKSLYRYRRAGVEGSYPLLGANRRLAVW